jgi:hypothetical protein
MIFRVTHLGLRLVGAGSVLLMFAVPVAAFVKLSGGVAIRRAGVAAAWRPIQPPIILAMRWDVGWALNGHTPSAAQMKGLFVSDALPVIPPPTSVSPPTPIPPALTSMPTTGWTLDTGATITTDAHDVLVLRPLTHGRPSLAGQGQGWRGAYWLPLNTAHWQNYTLGVTVTNLGAEGSGGSATVVVGHTDTHVGYAVSVSAARITIQNQNGNHIFSGVLSAATSHRVSVTLTKQLAVMVDGSPLATFQTGAIQGGMGFGVWKPSTNSNLPFFTNLWVRPD